MHLHLQVLRILNTQVYKSAAGSVWKKEIVETPHGNAIRETIEFNKKAEGACDKARFFVSNKILAWDCPEENCNCSSHVELKFHSDN